MESVFASHEAPSSWECLGHAYRVFHDECYVFGQNDYALKYAYTLSTLCDMGVSTTDLVHAIQATSHPKVRNQLITSPRSYPSAARA